MRTSILSAALAAALAITTWTPNRADAQVVVYPTMTSSPYVYTSYWTPSYNYAYSWANPYYSSYYSTWSNPYSYGTWNWYTPSTYYYSGYNYGYPYRWGGRYWRW